MAKDLKKCQQQNVVVKSDSKKSVNTYSNQRQPIPEQQFMKMITQFSPPKRNTLLPQQTKPTIKNSLLTQQFKPPQQMKPQQKKPIVDNPQDQYSPFSNDLITHHHTPSKNISKKINRKVSNKPTQTKEIDRLDKNVVWDDTNPFNV